MTSSVVAVAMISFACVMCLSLSLPPNSAVWVGVGVSMLKSPCLSVLALEVDFCVHHSAISARFLPVIVLTLFQLDFCLPFQQSSMPDFVFYFS